MLCAVQPSLVLKNESGKEKKINMCFCISRRNKLYISAWVEKKRGKYTRLLEMEVS
jgi:hypothetical protein